MIHYKPTEPFINDKHQLCWNDGSRSSPCIAGVKFNDYLVAITYSGSVYITPYPGRSALMWSSNNRIFIRMRANTSQTRDDCLNIYDGTKTSPVVEYKDILGARFSRTRSGNVYITVGPTMLR